MHLSPMEEDSELRSRRNQTFDRPTLFYAPLSPERKMRNTIHHSLATPIYSIFSFMDSLVELPSGPPY